jgi:hypothetical protein
MGMVGNIEDQSVKDSSSGASTMTKPEVRAQWSVERQKN